jgi:Trk K+ transport system NAD-binding subunit
MNLIRVGCRLLNLLPRHPGVPTRATGEDPEQLRRRDLARTLVSHTPESATQIRKRIGYPGTTDALSQTLDELHSVGALSRTWDGPGCRFLYSLLRED